MAVTILTGISMVNSIPVVSEVSKGKSSLEYNGQRLHNGSNKVVSAASKVLQKENEGVRMDSNNCYYATYGIDRQLHFSDYRIREYYTY